MIKRAIISDCGQYRYLLTRSWAPKHGALFFVMLNPSRADADLDDPTIRRCIGFAQREGKGGILVANLFAFRATKPEDMKRAADPFGPRNDRVLEAVGQKSVQFESPIICAWGSHGGLLDADKRSIAILRATGAKLLCFGTTDAGMPRHPLYLKRDQPLEVYSRYERAAA